MQTRKRSMIFCAAILISSLTTACGSPRLVVPRVEYKTYAEIEAEQPNCTPYIDQMEAAFNGGDGLDAEAAAIDTLNCYRAVFKIWENYYRILDAELQVINAHGE